MAQAENVFNCAVILRALVSVFDQQANAGASSNAFKNTGENFDLIRLAALGGIARCPVATTVEVMLQVRFRQRNAGGTPSTMQPSASPCDSPKVVTRKSCPIVFPAITAPLLLCLRVYLIFINREIFTGRQQLLFGEHKHTIAAVIKLQPVNGTSGYCSIRCTMLLPTSQINTPSSAR